MRSYFGYRRPGPRDGSFSFFHPLSRPNRSISMPSARNCSQSSLLKCHLSFTCWLCFGLPLPTPVRELVSAQKQSMNTLRYYFSPYWLLCEAIPTMLYAVWLYYLRFWAQGRFRVPLISSHSCWTWVVKLCNPSHLPKQMLAILNNC